MVDHLSSWEEEVNYTPKKHDKSSWKKRIFRAVVGSDPVWKMRFPRTTYNGALKQIEDIEKKDLWKPSCIEIKTEHGWELFKDLSEDGNSRLTSDSEDAKVLPK